MAVELVVAPACRALTPAGFLALVVTSLVGPAASVPLEGLRELKIPVSSSVIESEIFWLVT
jgi:hypothetical protein